MAETKIQWAHYTFNPWEGCVEVSAECDNCYARVRDARLHSGKNWGKDAFRMWHVDSYWAQLFKWNRQAAEAGEVRRVFCGSLCDVMEDREDLQPLRERLYRAVDLFKHLNFLFLTKRPQNFTRFLPVHWRAKSPANLWLGTTVGCNKSLWRIDALKSFPAAVLFLSVEPLIEDLPTLGEHLDGIDWVIFGGESGSKARACDIQWIRNGVAQCRQAGAAPFVKQLGAKPGQERDTKGDWHPWILLDTHGGDWDEWPEDLRVREFPK
jgi:protein gp37